jgi:hypothetical protein
MGKYDLAISAGMIRITPSNFHGDPSYPIRGNSDQLGPPLAIFAITFFWYMLFRRFFRHSIENTLI